MNELRFICIVSRITVSLIIIHLDRHSWATQICLTNGVSIETLSRTMGHRDISTTQIYAKITTQKIDEDMQALEKRIAGKYQLAANVEGSNNNELKNQQEI